MPEGDGYPKCFDPYLRYAISTKFRDFEFFDESRLFFLMEFKQAGQAKNFAEEMDAKSKEMEVKSEKIKFDMESGPADDNTRDYTRYTTARALKAAVDPLTFPIWEKYFHRVELSLPVKPSPEAKSEFLIERWQHGKESPALLFGMLDDGCPFAAAQFLTANGAAASTRVRAIWDQNQGKHPVNVNNGVFGKTPNDFNYGLEYLRDPPPPGGTAPRQVGLDEWIGLHSTPTHGIDEDGCYADAGFTTLARRESHGAHVMDVFAGRLPTSARIGPSKPGQDRRDPPSWNLGTDPASSAELVFVQFSDNCIRDATGVWLKAYVVDGIKYILSFAHPTKTKKVVINLSYGPTTGPHDGTAELEAALSALVAEYNGTTHNGTTPKRPRLEIVLAAGNAYLSEGHVVFTNDDEEPGEVKWTWRLPPDNTVLCFAEVWMDDADADGVRVTLTSPSKKLVLKSGVTPTLPVGGSLPIPSGTTPQVIGPILWGMDRMWLLEVGPTIAAPGANEHGDWTIEVEGIRENAEVHAYVARSDPNMGVRTGAKRSYFVDPEWERTRSAEASCTRIDGEFDKTGSLIRRDGTLNGIATAKKHRVHVAGGYVLANGRKSTFSSEGPARRGPRVGPDFALPCDESYALGGIRAGGNRSGAVFRLTGTSTAAPQLARQVAKLALPQPTNVPSPNNVPEVEKRGGGNIEPP